MIGSWKLTCLKMKHTKLQGVEGAVVLDDIKKFSNQKTIEGVEDSNDGNNINY